MNKALYLRAARGPVLLLTIGALFAVSQAGDLSISRTWPLILIILGALVLAERLVMPQTAVPAGAAPGPSYWTPGSSYVPAGGPMPRRVWRRRSIAGPLVLILIGVLFLLEAVVPDFSLAHLVALYWPYVLIGWGGIQLLEISAYAVRGEPAPVCSGGGWWVLVALICIFGSALFTFEQQRNHWWWYGPDAYRRSFAVFGPEHDYGINQIQRTVGAHPQVIIEGFRGDVKISGTNGTDVVVSGHKAIRAIDVNEANRVNETTPVQVVAEGDVVTVRCSGVGGKERIPVTASINVSVPKDASVRLNGLGGDLNISSLTGSVDITGRGGDVDLANIGGKVTVQGHYEGLVSMRNISQPVHVENMGTHLDLQRAPGQVRIDRGTLSAQNIIGPVTISTDATDVTLRNFSEGLELSVDRGDIDLHPAPLPLSKMNVHTRSGDIDLFLPGNAAFTLAASTRRGDIENQFSNALTLHEVGRGAHLQGSVGNGPEIHLTTDRGTITVEKAGNESKPEDKATEQGEPVEAGGEVTL